MSVEIIKYGNPLDGANDGIDKAILEMSIKIVSQASALSPVAEGTLRNSIMYKTGTGEQSDSGDAPPISPDPKRGEAYIGSAMTYAVYQEYGTRYIKPHPYLRPAVAIYGLGKAAADIMQKRQAEMMKGSLSKTKTRVNFFKD